MPHKIVSGLAGLGLAIAFTCPAPAWAQCTTLATSSIDSNFNGTSIPGNSFIWFSASASFSGIPTNSDEAVWFTNQTITVPGVGSFGLPATEVTVHGTNDPIPCAHVLFDPGTGPTGAWRVHVPTGGSDEIFIG